MNSDVWSLVEMERW